MSKQPTRLSLNRRTFLKLSGLSGAVLALGFSLPGTGGKAGGVVDLHNLSGPDLLPHEFNPFILLDSTGKIVLMAHKPEMGQGTYQSMPMILAEELEVRLDQVEIRPALGDPKYGNQSAGGSRSVRGAWLPLRQAGAAVREMLIEAAAQTWQVPPGECYAREGKVLHRTTGKNLAYGQLVEAARRLPVPKEAPLKAPENFRIVGKSAPRADIPAKVDGSAQFGLDVKVPGMLYASVERAPVFFGKPLSYDEAGARKIPGVKHVLYAERDVNGKKLHGVAVVADTYYAALQGRNALNVQWDNAGFDHISTESLYRQFEELAETEGVADQNEGNFAEHFAKARRKIEATYRVPFLSHSPLEPQNVVVHVREGECEIWAPTQVPERLRAAIAPYLGLPPDKIIIHVTFIGGGFGRRLFNDYVLEAAYLSRKLLEPVKVVWTREDDTTQGPFRPGALYTGKAGLNETGQPVAFQMKVIAPSIRYMYTPGADKTKPDESAMEGISHSPYEIPSLQTRFVLAETHLPLAPWRSVYASTNTFALESFMDELSGAAGSDPLAFRLALVGQSPRVAHLLKVLAEKSGWNKPLSKSKGKGVAIAAVFGSFCGHVVQVGRSREGKLKVEKVTSVIDCGQTINPDTVIAQTEGNIIMGLTAAIRDEITFEGGKAVQQNFDTYRMLTIPEVSAIDVHIIPSREAPGGVGEPGLPPLAPALTNAIFNATGKRIRQLPFDMDAL